MLARSAQLLLAAGISVSLAMLGGSILAQGQGGGDTTHGDEFGDLVHIKRDAVTGQPILQKREVLLSTDVLGWEYCPIPVDASGLEIPFVPLSCDPDPAYADSLVEVDYFGRLSASRTKERNQRMHFDETIDGIKNADVVTLDEAGRLLLGSDCQGDVCNSWRTIDSPMENLSMYRRVMKYGHIQTDPAEVDTSSGGDPNAGTPYHPALDAADWAKFRGPATALLPRSASSQCFGSAFDAGCAAPQALAPVDLFLAGSFLAGAADKTGKITPDLVQYLNRILKITVDTPESLATVNTLPALIRDENGVVAPATAGLPAPADERFVDFSQATYLRPDWFSKSVFVLQSSGGAFVPTTVSLMTWLNFINGPMTTTATNMKSFVASTSDSLRVVEFIHEYAIPADLWAAPMATTTSVAPVVAGYSSIGQNVALTATVASQSSTSAGGSVTFSVRTAASVAVGLPVTAALSNGTATATFVLPAGTEPQILTIAALFTPNGSFTTSQGTGTLTVIPSPTVTLVMPVSASTSSTPQAVTLAAVVHATPGDVINEGAFVFTVRDAGGAIVGAPVSGTVVGGAVSVGFTVPGALTSQRLTVIGDYLGTLHYGSSSGANQISVGCVPLTILPAVLPRAVQGAPYSQTFTSDGAAPTTFTLSGALPAGVSFAGDTLAGIPGVSGTFSFNVVAVDVAGCSATLTYTLDVLPMWAMVTGSGEGMEGTVQLLKADGTQPTGMTAPTRFVPFPESQFMNGIRVAMGDMTADGVPETLAALGPGGGPEVRVFDGRTGQLIRSFWAFDSWSGGGVFIATGDVNDDGAADVLVSQGWGAPHIRVFSGTDLAILYDFNAGAGFGTSGARIAAGDVDGDGHADILAASGPEVAPLIRVFSGASGALLREVSAFDSDLPGGLFIAAGDVNGDGKADIVAGAGEGTGSRVRIFDGVTLVQLRLFEAFEPWRLGGVRLACADVNGDGKADIIAAPGPGDDPHIHVFDGQTGVELYTFMAYPLSLTGGIYVGAGR